LERLATRLRLNVEFAGEVPHERVPDILARLDVFVMPSTYEGFGVAALEAQATEVPVVASGVYGIPDVVEDGVTGILVPPRDVHAIAGALISLVRDEERRRSMGRAGRRFVAERYSWEENAAQMETLYRDVLTRLGRL
jgi:glycosyltransferase involved in cell wall biosynthesis